MTELARGNRPAHGKATVLVVDDSATKRYLLVSWLTRAGFTVIEAETGGEALRKLAEEDVEADLVVLDVKLPDMSGFEVCERIKTDSRYGVLPVIHVSAHAVDVNDRTQGLNRGADAYLVEPIEPDELIATAQAVLRYYRARQRAELLAARMVRLAETTLAINSASTLPALLEAAALGAADIFGGPVVVVAETSEGESLAATGPPPAVRKWAVPGHCGSTARRSTSPCPAARRRPASRCCGSSRRRSRPRWRRSARSTRSTGSRSPCSAACCSRGCPRCPASRWPSATSRPARRPRWAATSTS